MATSHPHPRAHLLAGLRTGGVRSTSTTIPHSAAPGVSFTVPRFSSQHCPTPLYEDEEDQLFELPHHGAFNNRLAIPVTAAVDGPNNTFYAHQQMNQRGLNPNSTPFSPALSHGPAKSHQLQNQAFQMQMLQLEVLRLQQAQQQRQLQAHAEIMAQAQAQHQLRVQNQTRSTNAGYILSSSAGPRSTSFPVQSAPALIRHTPTTEQPSQLSAVASDDFPMTASLGGKFGSRTASMNVPSGFHASYGTSSPAAGTTTVISGGTPLGNAAGNKVIINPASKSDSASTWRRGGNNNSVLSGINRAVSSPSVKVTPPPEQENEFSSHLLTSGYRSRPQPLCFNGEATQPLPIVTINTSDSLDNDDTSSGSSTCSNSSPNTPRSSSSNGTSLSPREEASKKLYEGLGLGRPTSTVFDHQRSDHRTLVMPVATHRMVSQPTRQPRGPPSGADELGPKNFATRIRRQAIDGLGMLMGARERRELVEVY